MALSAVSTMNRIITLPILLAVILNCSGCGQGRTQSGNTDNATPSNGHIERIISRYESSGRSLDELVAVSRQVMKTVTRPANLTYQWQVELQPTEGYETLHLITNIWSVASITVGGDTNEHRYLLIEMADCPVGVWIFDQTMGTNLEGRTGHVFVKKWGDSAVVVVNPRQ